MNVDCSAVGQVADAAREKLEAICPQSNGTARIQIAAKRWTGPGGAYRKSAEPRDGAPGASVRRPLPFASSPLTDGVGECRRIRPRKSRPSFRRTSAARPVLVRRLRPASARTSAFPSGQLARGPRMEACQVHPAVAGEVLAALGTTLSRRRRATLIWWIGACGRPMTSISPRCPAGYSHLHPHGECDGRLAVCPRRRAARSAHGSAKGVRRLDQAVLRRAQGGRTGG